MSLFFKGNNSNVSVSSSDTSSIVTEDVSSFDVDDLTNVADEYVSAADKSPELTPNEDGDYVINDNNERYYIDKTANKVLWVKKLQNKSNKDSVTIDMDYNVDASDIFITITTPSGKSYFSDESREYITYTGFSSVSWKLPDSEIGEYTVEVQGVNLYDLYVKIS